MLRNFRRSQVSRCLPIRPILGTKSSRARFSALAAVHECLVTIHDVTHLPWYLVIPLSTFTLSLVTLPIAIRSRKNQLKIAALQPILGAQVGSLRTRLRRTSTPAGFSRDVSVASRALRRSLYRRHGVDLLSVLAVPALRFPLWLALSLAIRSMAGRGVPFVRPLAVEESFRVEGVAWMGDLTEVDTMLLLPVTFGLLSLINVEVMGGSSGGGGGAAAAGTGKGRLRVTVERGMRLFSVLMIPVAAQMPAALCLYWVSSAASTLGVNVWLNHRFPTTTTTTTATSVSQDAGTTQTRLELPGVDETAGKADEDGGKGRGRE
ncbi:protein of unknown function [Taphrina deformans PYCC 5710]|uniref:Membrane insertase YidC/Oxa/ALB C-terminal domain-containing protein n=1 Tax=Taphrina deformans (strain PYCC 5710 / ATCC 11124 / CBS 356.35 / IMI 108563 / JCM 9778 / NBRC 8474) TaxID=1097556 RepID=R4XBH9_TAPDE|nr:protein of unknown function [Taphrina deformans PYCC 5710]|eukprot:CCG82950.1 protein of unknown function [Taphrina deformans PYCC 5710]